MNISNLGLDYIKRFEGYSATPYNDTAGHATIGYGHLIHYGSVTPADRERYKNFTKAAAEDYLRSDIAGFVAGLNKRLQGIPVTQNQFDALMSWVYNLGFGNFDTSTLYQRLKEKNYAAVPAEFARWVKSGGKITAGLVTRRAAEAALFAAEDVSKTTVKILPLVLLAGIVFFALKR